MITTDTVTALLAAPPPRAVPAAVRRAARSWASHTFLPLFGVFFLVIGIPAAAAFLPWKLLEDWQLGSGRARSTAGVVVATEKTSLSIDDIDVVCYTFGYQPAGGPPQTARCYTTGARWTEGARVTVRYFPAKPAVARIEGARRSAGNLASIAVLLFPLIGGAMAGVGVFARWRTLRVLREGVVVEAEVVSVDETSTQINYKSIYRIVVRSPAFGGDGTVTTRRVAEREVRLALARARDRQPTYVLRHPRHPKHLLFPEAWVEPAATRPERDRGRSGGR